MAAEAAIGVQGEQQIVHMIVDGTEPMRTGLLHLLLHKRIKNPMLNASHFVGNDPAQLRDGDIGLAGV
ncbi:hypothetical protein [Xanthomonas oryzae]|uniref:hypothetical protein n=1 Tax=Xanthomonas oryzae TaxID=347 RepID=UPI0015C0AFE9|nr:hypothetical protein [Xanthomonas oryzae]